MSNSVHVDNLPCSISTSNGAESSCPKLLEKRFLPILKSIATSFSLYTSTMISLSLLTKLQKMQTGGMAGHSVAHLPSFGCLSEEARGFQLWLYWMSEVFEWEWPEVTLTRGNFHVAFMKRVVPQLNP
ncbi:hypothetical protein JG688_00017040 [Phytophthora aleatoria]|uniref:Uncharacterized protein n=1 Tax=Phytophthora aleatoria TaxID=2496075 RepID=A0A8J5M1L5_9STRA|nr:hypothetical protein JG688_00017040 [Phytophthora aleatoria]